VDITLPDGRTTRLPALPVEMDGGRFGKRRDLKAPGADSREVLQELGLSGDEIDALVRAGAVG
jgi:crotonobetainyl-CoA:carnitine CoA-transferase CaiB-like acyl-CoA transferase